MALGKSGISAARSELQNISNEVRIAEEANMHFIQLFMDPDFQTFAEETGYGSQILNQLEALAKWMGEMCSTIETLTSKTNSYLNRQEELNK
jgi:hypothetical protein